MIKYIYRMFFDDSDDEEDNEPLYNQTNCPYYVPGETNPFFFVLGLTVNAYLNKK